MAGGGVADQQEEQAAPQREWRSDLPSCRATTHRTSAPTQPIQQVQVHIHPKTDPTYTVTYTGTCLYSKYGISLYIHY